MHKNPPDISDLDIQALVDGELEGEAAREMHRAITNDPAKLQRYEELLDQKELLQEWWATFKQEH